MVKKKIVLIDQDGVISDIEAGFRKAWSKKYPKIPCPLPENRKTHSFKGEFNKGYFDKINSIIYSRGFIENLPPIPGSIEALIEIANKGHKVFICTVPLLDYTNCAYEKYRWVEKHLGQEWTKRIIFTRDKSLVKGDILIDDNPGVSKMGLKRPAWEHIIYDQPYNRHITNKKRISWNNWRKVLKL